MWPGRVAERLRASGQGHVMSQERGRVRAVAAGPLLPLSRARGVSENICALHKTCIFSDLFSRLKTK